MRHATVTEIVTPKKVILNGLWFGPAKPKRAVVWVHGLTSSVFARLEIVTKLVDANTAVLTFNNRGHDYVAPIRTLRKGKNSMGGAGHEVFTDCVDDIQGAVNYATLSGAKEIYLVGHSTGCQKSIYWMHKKRGAVKGIILLAPLSDYVAALHLYGARKIARAAAAARALVRADKPHELLSAKVWTEGPVDAQRFLSLNTPDSVENQIFPYFDPAQKPRILGSVRVPMLAILAEEDEYADRAASRIADWLRISSPHIDIHSVPSSGHSFKGFEHDVAQCIKAWISEKK